MQMLVIKPGTFDRLKDLYGLSESELAERIGVSRSTYYRVLGGESPTARFIAGLCVAFGLKPGDVLEIAEKSAA